MSQAFDDLDQGWSWVVLVTCFLSNMIVGTMNYIPGLIHSTLLLKYQENQATTAVVGSLHPAIMNIAGPLSSLLIDRFSVRTAIITGGFLFTVGYLATAVAPSLYVATVTCGIISGLGGAVGWTATMIAPGFYFRRYRNVAFGIVLSGTGVGIFGLPPLIQTAADTYGSFGFFVCLAGITVHLIAFGASMIPSTLEKSVHETRFLKKENSAPMVTSYFQVFKHKSVGCMSFSLFLNCFGSYIVFLYLPTFCAIKGASPMQASYILSVCGAVSIVGRLLTGLIMHLDRFDAVYLFGGSSAVLGVTTMLFPLVSATYVGQIIYATCLGLTFGCPFVSVTPINLSFLGVSHMAIALGVELCIGGIGAIIGPIVAGLMLDAGFTYTAVFILSGSVMLMAGFFGLIPVCFSRPDRTAMKTELEVSYQPAQTDEPTDCPTTRSDRT